MSDDILHNSGDVIDAFEAEIDRLRATPSEERKP